MREFLAIARALSDENRVRALAALWQRELCVCQITELLELAPSTVSKHMTVLRQAGLVEGRKTGRWMHYRLAEGVGSAIVDDALDLVRKSLDRDPCIQEDAARLEGILEIDPEIICRRQAERLAG